MEKWREMTSIEDYEFDPDGNYDGSLSEADWQRIFIELYQRAETTEEYLDNPWVDPVSTRNAYTYRTRQARQDYIVLKYYDGMYALYEINPDYQEESFERPDVASVIEKLDKGVSIRQAILEAVQGNSGILEDVAGMEQEEYEVLRNLMDKWTGGSGKGGWNYDATVSNGGKTFVITLKKNPITELSPITIEKSGDILNGEIYHEQAGEYLSSTGPVTYIGLKSMLRDLESQKEMVDAEQESEENPDESGNIYA